MVKIHHIIFLLFLLSCITDYFDAISNISFVLLLYSFINSIGKKLLFVESISLYSCVIYLIVPQMGYSEYTYTHPLAKLWELNMQVPHEEYFSFALPAILLFIFSIHLFDSTSVTGLSKILGEAKNSLKNRKAISINLLLVGLVSFYFRLHVPSALSYVLTILYLGSFAGLMYIYFSPFIERKSKALIVSLFGVWLLINSISQGMFTVIIYMGISVFGILMLNNRFSLVKKSMIILVLALLTLVLQFSKTNYRALVRSDLVKGENTTQFIKLYFYNMMHINEAFNFNSFFGIYARTNQGYQLARVMDYMPSRKPFDGGSRLGESILASFVPRLFWPDKPVAGGRPNMRYYANVFLEKISMDVGPIGEGYGSFGRVGGILYMFFFGSFLGISFSYFISLCRKYPLLLFWQPLVFFEVIYCMENDTMQAMNSLIKIGFFLFVLFKLAPVIIDARNKQPKPLPTPA